MEDIKNTGENRIKKLNIWLIQRGEPLPFEKNFRKMRTGMLADKLIEKGHSVLWWTSAFDHSKKDWKFRKDTEVKINNDFKVIALKGIGYKRNVSLFRYIDHKIIARKFKRMAPKELKPDIIVASMPTHDLAYEAVMFAKKNNVLILIDIRDKWPDLFLDYVPAFFRRLVKILLSRDFLIIKKTMQMADGLISMMNNLLEWGLNYAQRKKNVRDRVFYLGSNKRVFSKKINSKKMQNLLNSIKDKFIVTFIGVFGHNYNPSILLDCAMKLLNKDIVFVLGGDGEFFNEIKQKSPLLSNVILPGWLDNDEINILLEYSNIGIIPATKYINAFPNKAFTYLSAGLPIISALQGEFKEIIEKYKIGFYFPPNDVDTLVDCIRRLYENRKLCKEMSKNARKIFEEMFDADKIYEGYAKHIEDIVYEYNKA